jgi:magnesium chelatase family protein
VSLSERELARVVAGTLDGLDGLRIQVEVDLARSLPAFHLVGLPSATVRESRERVGAALRHSGFHWPERRITVNLAPADRPKEGAGLDLALAAGLLLASGQLPRPGGGLLGRTLLVGELALDGHLRPVRGLAALALDAARLGVDRLLVPRSQVAEVDAAVDLPRYGLAHLSELPRALAGLARWPRPAARGSRPAPAPAAGLEAVRGQEQAKRAVVLAAAGGHHLLLLGPPGCGKTLLARALPELLPPLDGSARAERLRVASCAGLPVDPGAAGRPPLRAPHHSVSAAGLVGGGRPLRPGEVTLAHQGVLFLDELPLFPGRILDLLREPLEEGWIQVDRAERRLRLPAAFQLVAAANPCPCGWHGSRMRSCACPSAALRRWRSRLSGPLRDRIDLWVEMDREPAERWFAPPGASSADAVRKAAHRVRARRRGRGLEGDALRRACALAPADRRWMEDAADRAGLSVRALAGVLRVARTVADLRGARRVDRAALAEALAFRPPV